MNSVKFERIILAEKGDINELKGLVINGLRKFQHAMTYNCVELIDAMVETNKFDAENTKLAIQMTGEETLKQMIASIEKTIEEATTH